MSRSAPDDDVAEQTRRIVGRAALKRASRIVRDWQAEQREKAALARRIAVVFAALGAVVAAALISKHAHLF